jgi:hypothetical protein
MFAGLGVNRGQQAEHLRTINGVFLHWSQLDGTIALS